MHRCPLCGSARIVSIIATPPRGFCTGCGVRWIRGPAGRVTPFPAPRLRAVTSDPDERSAS
jgi:hypothetical protein